MGIAIIGDNRINQVIIFSKPPVGQYHSPKRREKETQMDTIISKESAKMRILRFTERDLQTNHFNNFTI